MCTPLKTFEVSKNRLVAALAEPDLCRWMPLLKRVDLPLGAVLSEEGVKPSHVYFPTTAIVSKLHVMEDGSSAEIALVGSEGVVGISIIMGGLVGVNRAVVVTAGQALRMKSEHFREEVARPVILNLLLRYIQALISQMSHTAVCNRHHILDQQLCRWILLSMDRTQGNRLVMTHELIATMLGVRREGVTESAMKLQKAGLIRYARGRIEVIDRAGIEQRACECYGVVRKVYDHLLPPAEHAQDGPQDGHLRMPMGLSPRPRSVASLDIATRSDDALINYQQLQGLEKQEHVHGGDQFRERCYSGMRSCSVKTIPRSHLQSEA